jgi:uncharacterized damage-inducible protein DinB
MPETLPLHDRLKARLRLVREDLHEVMGRLQDADLAFAPAEGMRTIGGQLAEIAGTERQIMAWLRDGERIPFQEANDFGAQGSSLAGMSRALEEVRSATLAYLDSLSDEELKMPVKMPKGWFESLGAEAVPPSEVFRSIAQHEWYHVGQLVSYQWFRGDDPYKW